MTKHAPTLKSLKACLKQIKKGVVRLMKRHEVSHCPCCQKPFIKRAAQQKYCSEQCLIKATRNRTRLSKRKQAEEQNKIRDLLNPRRRKDKQSDKTEVENKSLDDWCREAAECNLDYGNYRALITQGKSFDELKAQAPFRQTPAHSHITWEKKS